jgi:hypothetical protein
VSASIEDAAGVGRETFVADLSRLLAAVEGVLARIDALVDFIGQPTDPTAAARPTDRTSSSSRCPTCSRRRSRPASHSTRRISPRLP